MKAIVKGITVAVGMISGSAFAGMISFENGFNDQQKVYAVDTGANAVDFSIWTRFDRQYRDYAYIARIGGLETTYAFGDGIPDGHDGGQFFLTDAYNAPRTTTNHRFDFARGINSFGLDPWDQVTVAAYMDFGHADEENSIDTLRFSSIPEPGTFALFGIGLLGLAFARRQHH